MRKLTPEGCQARRQRLIEAVDVDLFVIVNPRHIFYFTGLFVTPLLLSAWGLSALLIERKSGRTILLMHEMVGGQAHDAYVDEVELYRWYNGGEGTLATPDLFGAGVAAIGGRIKAAGARIIGYESGWLPLGLPVDNGVDVNSTLINLRRSKQADELDLIREAVRVNEAGHRAARAAIQPGASELDVFNAFHSAANLALGEAVHLMGDFVSGARALQGGGLPTDRRMSAGEVMIVDAFPIVNGYRPDFTATTAVTPDVTDNQRRLDRALHDALAAGEALLKPGTPARDVYAAVRARLDDHGFAEHFPHHAGHGLGLGHPESPFFVPSSDQVLQLGDVVTLEPGAYGDDFGARIEHNYLIAEDGYERLSNHETALIP
ncbi:MAG: aminopeptidase P family protein [Anaerolineae bacterium]|nr:aminopeptidase P family protein [Anaerolineae bacterium]